jgi:hypothetical protein
MLMAAVAIVACGSTTFQSTWSDPDAGPLRIEDGTKIITFFATDNEAKRRGLETALANELGEHGIEGVPAHSVLPAERPTRRWGVRSEVGSQSGSTIRSP